MYARRGEVQGALAAESAGIPTCLSTMSICTLEEVAASIKRPLWFQLYMVRDRAFMHRLLDEAERVGCSALVFTVDMPVAGTRYRDSRSGLSGNPGLTGALRRVGQAMLKPSWAWDVGIKWPAAYSGECSARIGLKTGLEISSPGFAPTSILAIN